MKIAHVTATFPPYYSGTGMVCWHNALGLAERGHTVTVLTANHPPTPYSYPDAFAVRRLPVRFRIGNAPLLPGLIAALRGFDIIHLHHPFIFGAELVCAAARLFGIPLVMTHHNDLIGDGLRQSLFDAYSLVSLKLLFATARKFIVVTADHAHHCRLAPLFRRRAADLVEVPNGVDSALFTPSRADHELKRSLGIPPDARTALFVGALDRAHHFRRVDLLLQAMQQLPDASSRLVIVGDGDRADDYKALAQQLGLAARVHFLGRIPHGQLARIYNLADLVVLPSHLQESFGMVLIEGMACAKPVLGSDLPGVRSIVSHDRDGLLVPAGDVAALAAAMGALLRDPARSEAMGARGRAKVEATYTWDAITPRLEAVYREALRDAHVRRRPSGHAA